MLSTRRMLIMEDDKEMKEWKLINDITIDEDIRTITIDKDSNNQSFNINDFLVQINGVSDASSNQANSIRINDELDIPNMTTVYKSNQDISAGNSMAIIWNSGCVICGGTANGSFGGKVTGINFSTKTFLFDPVNKIELYIASATYKFKAGTNIKIYGR